MQTSTGAFATMVAGNAMVVEQQVTLTLPLYRRNLCSCPSFENGLGNWLSSGGSSISSSTLQSFTGTNSLLLTWGTSGTNGQFLILPSIPGMLGGETFVLSCYVYLDTNSPGVQLVNGTGGNTVTTTGSWQRLQTTIFTTLGGSAFLLTNTGPVTAGTHARLWVDAVMIEQTSTLNSYFDGSTAGASWDPPGTAGLTTSRLNVDPLPDVSPTVIDCRVQRSMTTDMPAGTTFISGYPTAAADITLAGNKSVTDPTTNIAQVLNPYNVASPYYGLEMRGSTVQVASGLYSGGGGSTPEMFTNFTGILDEIDVNPIDGTVKLVCVDKRQSLRTVPVLPAVGAYMDTYTPSITPINPGLTSAWVLDALLRANGLYSSPGPRVPYPMYYASMAGSAFPLTYGISGYPVQAEDSAVMADEVFGTTRPMKFVQGHFNQSVCRDSSVFVSVDTRGGSVSFSAGSAVFLEWWMNTAALDPALGVASGSDGIFVGLKSTDGAFGINYDLEFAVRQVSANVWELDTNPLGGGSLHTFATTAGWQQFSLSIAFSSTATVTYTLWVDKVSIGSFTFTAPTFLFQRLDVIDWFCSHPIESIQLTNETYPLPLAAFTPTAYLDESLNNLVATIDPATNDPWQIIQQLMSAEGGVAGFDELGVFRFQNRNTIRTSTASRSISVDSSLKSYDIDTLMSSTANHITSNVNALTRSTFTSVWAAGSAVYYADPGKTITIVASLPEPVVSLSTLTGVVPSGGVVVPHYISGYRASAKANGSGRTISFNMQVAQTAPSTVVIELTNTDTVRGYLVTPFDGGFPAGSVGQPAIALGGEFVQTVGISTDLGTGGTSVTADSQWPDTDVGGAVTDPNGAIALQLSDNPWRQDPVSAQSFTDDTLADLVYARAILNNLRIVADPRLQLTDRVTCVDNEYGLDDDVILFGIVTDTGTGQWEQQISARAVGSPGGWIMGETGHSELGTSTRV